MGPAFAAYCSCVRTVFEAITAFMTSCVHVQYSGSLSSLDVRFAYSFEFYVQNKNIELHAISLQLVNTCATDL